MTSKRSKRETEKKRERQREEKKNAPHLGHCDHAGRARVVDAVVELVDAARVDDLLARDVRAWERADSRAELGHRAVVLRAAVEPHVRVGEVAGGAQGFAAGEHERAAADVLVGERLAEAVRRGSHGAAQQQAQLGQERLAERAALVLELVRVQVVELLLRGLEPARGAAVLALEQGDDGRDVLEVATLEQLLEEAAELRF